MSDWSTIIYISAGSATLLLSVLGLCFTAIISGIDRWSKHFFLCYFSDILLFCLFALVGTAVLFYPFSVAAVHFFLFLECLFLSLPLPMLTAFLLHCNRESLRTSKLFRTVFSLWMALFVLLVSTLFTNDIILVTEERMYYRGPLYTYMLLPAIVILLLNLAGLIRRRKQLSRKIFLSFIVALLPMLVVLIVQIFFEVYPMFNICLVLTALSMYGLILSDQIEKNLRNQREIANQHASIMVLQMRPHFIYNTMTSIYCLCDQNPQMARQVVMDFTSYLRKNFTAIASSMPIPFSSELEHTRAYLAVEKAFYADSLFVDYDTPHTWFRVPPLTLQPVVENAVKHGRDPYASPFHISIRTRKVDSGSEIVVADNGPGFSPADDSEPHIALNNIRQRLEMMCRGRLTISDNDGGGTVVTLLIPDSTENKPGIAGFL